MMSPNGLNRMAATAKTKCQFEGTAEFNWQRPPAWNSMHKAMNKYLRCKNLRQCKPQNLSSRSLNSNILYANLLKTHFSFSLTTKYDTWNMHKHITSQQKLISLEHTGYLRTQPQWEKRTTVLWLSGRLVDQDGRNVTSALWLLARFTRRCSTICYAAILNASEWLTWHFTKLPAMSQNCCLLPVKINLAKTKRYRSWLLHFSPQEYLKEPNGKIVENSWQSFYRNAILRNHF